jgi:DNA-binding response OmpR family regulator
MRLLIVEDNVALADELLLHCRRQGYSCDWLVDGRDATSAPFDNPYEAIVLDLGLPGKNGLILLQEWRQQGLATPVLVLTARNSWQDRIAGLQAGADDYLGKPFHPDELLLRIRALIRRNHGVTASASLEAGGLTLNEETQSVKDDDHDPIILKGGEFRLLRYFMLHPGKVLSKLRLAEQLQSEDREHNSNVLEVYISHLRDKLGKHCIETRRGQGYVFHGKNEK